MDSTVEFLRWAKESASSCPLADTREARIISYKSQLRTARRELASVLPIEGELVRRTTRERVKLLKHLLENPTFSERYPRLSMEVLKWRDADGYPRLVPFSLSSSFFEIGLDFAKSKGDIRRINQALRRLPPSVADMYEDVFGVFQRHLDYWVAGIELKERVPVSWKERIYTEFNGVIPLWVREKISSAIKDFPPVPWWGKLIRRNAAASIFILAEVNKWEVNRKTLSRRDPLVVGYMAGCLWLICSFDETPLEEYVKREFAI